MPYLQFSLLFSLQHQPRSDFELQSAARKNSLQTSEIFSTMIDNSVYEV